MRKYKIYKYKTNFDRDFEKDDEITDDEKFNMNYCRMHYDVRNFYEAHDKEKLEAYGDVLMGYKNKNIQHYEESEVFERFKLLFDFENSDGTLKLKQKLIDEGDVSERAYEEAKREYFRGKGF